jgi:hypothetical protein
MGHTSEDDLGELEPRGSGASKVYTYAKEEQTASYGMQDGDLEQGAVRLEPFFWDWTLALETAPEGAAFIEHDKVSSKNGEGGILLLKTITRHENAGWIEHSINSMPVRVHVG